MSASEEELRTAFLKARQFLKRLGWSSAEIAERMGVSEITARQYAQAPDTQGSRAVQPERLERLQAAVKAEAADLILQAMGLVSESEKEFGR